MSSQTDDVNLQASPSSWVGLNIGDYLIDRQIGEGAFSWVYLGKHRTDNTPSVFKVAKPAGLVGKMSNDATQFFPTRALIPITGSFLEARPDAADLLLKQFEKLTSVSHRNLLKIDKFENNGAVCYYQCEYVEGQTLRQMIGAKAANLPILIELAQALAELSKAGFNYHGDLKPDNIIVTKSGIKIIDPGFFGALTNNGLPVGDAAVTTPAYYPLLQPDDLFAFGVIAWEVLTGEHPIPSRRSSDQIDTSQVSPELLSTIEMREATGNYFGSGLLALQHPFKRGVTRSLGDVLLKLLRLGSNDQGILYPEPGFDSFSAIADALSESHC